MQEGCSSQVMQQRKDRLKDEDWQLVKQRSGLGRGHGLDNEGLLQRETSGSRFSILEMLMVSGSSTSPIMHRLRQMRGQLRLIHHRQFAAIDLRILDARTKLLLLQQELRDSFSPEVKSDADSAAAALKELLEAKGFILKQRLKQD
ncbi:hypothetical protein Dimus_021241 [Dionaea muscipula]